MTPEALSYAERRMDEFHHQLNRELEVVGVMSTTGFPGNDDKSGDPKKARMLSIRSSIEGELAAATRAYLNIRLSDTDIISK